MNTEYMVLPTYVYVAGLDYCTTCFSLFVLLFSSLGRSLPPLWYLPALTKIHRPLLKILHCAQQLKKCRLKCFRGSTSLRR